MRQTKQDIAHHNDLLWAARGWLHAQVFVSLFHVYAARSMLQVCFIVI
jgi:hypothetical protein